jgi:anti-anti-sigma factor
MPTDLSLHVTAPGTGLVRLAAAGEIDMASAPQLDRALTDALTRHEPRHIEVDLAEVSFLDSSGINALVGARSRAASTGCRFSVTNPAPPVRRVLDVTGLSAVFGLSRP